MFTEAIRMSTKSNHTENASQEVSDNSPLGSVRGEEDIEIAGSQLVGASDLEPVVSTESSVRQRLPSVLGRFGRTIPTVLVMGALAGLGYFGHHYGWKVPKFSELTGHGEATGVAWCEEHGVPEDACVSCNADLMPKGTLHGWCKEHGLAECLFEHPELGQLKEPAVISQQDLERAQRALATRERPKNDPSCKLHLRRIQFASREAADKAGIDIALVARGRIVETVATNGEIRYDPTRVTRLSSRAPGTVWRVMKNVGDPVREGDLLALVDAALVGQAKAELLQAAAQLNLQDQTVERLAGLGDVVAGRRLQETSAAREEAEASVRKAAQVLANLGLPVTLDDVRGKNGSEIVTQLHSLGLPSTESQDFDSSQNTANLVPVLSPRDGVVTTRDVVAGEAVDTTKAMFTIVDNRRMWLMLNVPLEDARYVKAGQQVVFRPDGGTHEHTGPITWISSHLDSETRTVKVRAELPNDGGDLRDESFGAGLIVLRDEADAIIAPNDAIHWEGCCYVAFVRDRNFLDEGSFKVFHTRMVRPGVKNGDYTELIAGLLPDEVVVTKGSGVLRAELLKGNLGAG